MQDKVSGLWETQYASKEKALLKVLSKDAQKKWKKQSLYQKISIIDKLQTKKYWK